MIRLTSGILNCRENVLTFEIRIIFENFFEVGAGTQQFQNIGYANAHAPNARTTTALSVIDRDATEAFRLHFPSSVSVYNLHQRLI
jgi:hypothetical protein